MKFWDAALKGLKRIHERHPEAKVRCPTCGTWGTSWPALKWHIEKCAARERAKAEAEVEA